MSPETPVEVVHTGVDTNGFSPGPYRDDGYLLTVGRLNDPRKNMPLLLRAYAAARARSSRMPRLVLAGVAGPDRESRELIAELGVTDSVQYIGPQDRRALADVYRGASAFVLSSNEEGQGIVVVEAMASGLPIVATSCVGPSELITDGVEGLLTPVGCVTASRTPSYASPLIRSFAVACRTPLDAAPCASSRSTSTGAQLCRTLSNRHVDPHRC